MKKKSITRQVFAGSLGSIFGSILLNKPRVRTNFFKSAFTDDQAEGIIITKKAPHTVPFQNPNLSA